MALKQNTVARNKFNGDPTPVYFQLQKELLKEIENGRWLPGQSIPPERAMAESHQLSVGTVKKAILNLVNEGYLYRIQGKGTFVAGMTLQPESLRYYRFLEDFSIEEVADILGIRTGTVKSRTNRAMRQLKKAMEHLS